MGFKISLVPFHLWTADTYEGAPTVVTGFLSVISKGSAAFVLFTVLVQIFSMNGELFAAWNHALMWIIIASITIANLFAIRQKNLKRFMAFSAISQAGYLVLAVMGGTAQGRHLVGVLSRRLLGGQPRCLRRLGISGTKHRRNFHGRL